MSPSETERLLTMTTPESDVIAEINEIESRLDEMPASGTEPDSDERADLVDRLAVLRDAR